MKSWVKAKAQRVGRGAFRYAHLDDVTPATPRAYRLLRDVFKRRAVDAIPTPVPEEVSAKEFVEHWVRHGWTMPGLVAAYRNLYRTAWSLLTVIIVSTIICIAHVLQAPTFQPVFTGTGIMAIGMFVLAYLHILMLMWRIRERKLNAMAWPRRLAVGLQEWLPQPLTKDYIQKLRADYDKQR